MPQRKPVETPDSAAIFNTYHHRIHRYILSLVRDPAGAQDLTQETFLRAHRRREALREPEALGTWLYRIATHVCLDRLRQRGPGPAAESQPHVDRAEHAFDLPDSDSPPLQQVIEQQQMSACVLRYLDRLANNYRAVILLHDLEGLTNPEIAELLGMPLATVKIRLHRARAKLRAVLQDACTFSCDERGVFICEPKP